MDRVSIELEVKIDETTEITEPEETLIRTPLENEKDSNDLEVIL